MGVLRYRSVVGLFLFLASVLAGTAHARPEFAGGGSVKMIFPVGETTNLDLRSLLTDPSNPKPLTWKQNAPTWITVAGDTLTASPTASSTSTFNLTVCEPVEPNGVEPCAFALVNLVAGRPPVWGDTDLKRRPQDIAVSIDLTTLATHPDGEPMTFSIDAPQNNSGWLKINGNKLEGTPLRANVGAFDLMLVATSTKTGLKASKKAFGEVTKTPAPPKFLAKPIVLPDATEDLSYNQSINTAAFVSHPEPEPISFAVTAGQPAWLSVDGNGNFTGVPVRKDGGAVSLTVKLTQVIDGQSYTDTTTVNFKVNLVNKPPVWSMDPIVLPDAPVKKLVTANLAPFATDIDNDKLTFRKVSGPAWGDVNSTGGFSGTPKNTDVGPNVFEIEVSDGKFPVVTHVQVKVFNSPPTWNSDPIVLKKAKEDADYLEDLRNYAKDPDGDLLGFELVTGPGWITINNDGSVKGIPRRIDVGLNTLRVRVTDNVSGSAEVDVQLTVDKTNKAPEWTQNPIQLKDAPERSEFSDSVAGFAKDIDGDVLSFEKVSGPAWVKVAADGTITGTPQRADVGTTSVVVKVKDQQPLSANVTVLINVLKVNRPPTWKVTQVDLPNATEGIAFSFALAPLVEDLDNDSLVFKMVSGPAWLKILPNGALSGVPALADVGTYTAIFEVTDGEAAAQVNANGKVLKANRAPKWAQNPITLSPNARAEESYQQDLSVFASDEDGDTLTFRKLSGPGWASVSSNGLFSGLPKRTDVGTPSFTVEVSDGKLQAVVTVKLTVDKAFEPPKWKQEPILLPDALEGSMFTFNLLPFVTDPENDPLTFRLVRGPAWLTLSPQGQLTGIPQHGDIGSYTAVFEVSDQKFQVTVGAMGRVIPKNDPPTVDSNALVFAVKERETLLVNLVDPKYIKDPEGDKLTFKLLDTRDWVVLSADGKLTLTPKHKDIGDHVLKFTVADTKNPAVPGTITIQVQEDPKAPTWKQDPIRFTAKAGKLFSATVADKVTDVDNFTLTFTKQAGPPWMAVNNDGTLTGTPAESDVGANTFMVNAKNAKLGSDVTVIVTVETGNSKPVWAKDPIVLPDATVGLAYSQSVASFVTDPDGDPLKFEGLSGPDWVYVTSTGGFLGVPEQMDLGVNTFKVRAKDSKGAFADVTVLIQVKEANKPPFWTQSPINLGDAVVGKLFTFNLAAFAVSPDGDPITFKKVSGPTWLNASAGGQLSGTPKEADLGPYTAVFEVSDGRASAQVDAFGQVIKGQTNKPRWLEDPIHFTAKENNPFSASVANKVSNPLPGALTFAKVSGPTWLNVASNGALSGTPKTADLGMNSFTLSATNADGTSNVSVFIDVQKADAQGGESIRIDEPVPGARVDNLWVIDNSPTCSGPGKCLIYDLQKYIDLYFAALEKAGIHHLGMYYSSDACAFAKPIKDKVGKMLISWEDTDNAGSFNERLTASKGQSRYNSPLTQMTRFFKDVTSMTGIDPFFEKSVPLDAMIVTAHPDHYKTFQTSGSLTVGWDPADFADYYKKKAVAAEKPFRTSAIAPKCPTTAFPSTYSESDTCTYAGGENPYQTVVRATNGTFYAYHDRSSVKDALLDYADKVVFGAFVRAHKRIHLSSTPIDVSKIQVTLAGTILPGNTGSSTDKWSYDSAANDIVVYWDRIDLSKLNPGDRLEITYPKASQFLKAFFGSVQ